MSAVKRIIGRLQCQIEERFNTQDKPLIVWEYFFMSAVVAGFLATQIKIDGIQVYSQLVVSDLAIELGSKVGDYRIPLLALLYGVGLYFGLDWLGNALEKRVGSELSQVYRQMGTYALVPASLWLGTQLVGGDSLLLIWISVALILSLIAGAATTALTGIRFRRDRHFAMTLTASMLIPLLAPLNVIAVFLLKRILDPLNPPSENAIWSGIYISLGIGLLLPVALWIGYRRHYLRLQHELLWVLLLAQGLLPLLFLVLIPFPWVTETGILVGFAATPPLMTLLVLLLIWSYADWSYADLAWRGYQLFSARFQRTKVALSLPLSLPVVLVILLFLKTAFLTSPALTVDDYHSGEFLLPWWLWSDFGQLPFQGYFPARGLINYVPGFLANLFFDGTAAAFNVILAKAIMVLPYMLIGLAVLSKSIGLFPAFLSLLILPSPSGVFEIHLILTVSLCILVEFFLKQRWVEWLALWGGIGIALILFAPGQGGLFVLGTMPLGFIALYQAFRRSPLQLAQWLGGFLAILVLLALFTPLDQMLLGAVTYLLEQSSINSVAYGLLWEKSQGTNPTFGYPLWELLRTAWLWVGGIAALLLYRIWGDRSWPDRQRYMAYAVPIVLYTILWIPRAAGRIDPGFGAITRLGIVSVWFISLLLPIVLLVAFGQRYHAKLLVGIAMIAGLVVSNPVGLPVVLEPVLTYPAQTFHVQAADFELTQTLGLPKLGTVTMTSEQVDRLSFLKTVLEAVVDPGETYLDLTNRNSQYFYLNYPVPIELGAIGNLIHVNQQQRAIQDLEANLPPIALVSGASLAGSSALRSHLIYRYVITKYIPVQVEAYIFMVRPDRLARLNPDFLAANNLQATPPVLATYTGDPSALILNEFGKILLDRAFLTYDLQSIPSAWGRSWDTLLPELELVTPVDLNTLATPQDLGLIASNQYEVMGAQPRLQIDLSALNIVGDQAGLLTFDFACNAGSDTTVVTLTWQSPSFDPAVSGSATLQFRAHDGKQIVPLDSAPRWLLAQPVQSLELALADPVACSAFSVTNMELRQRRSASELAALVAVD